MNLKKTYTWLNMNSEQANLSLRGMGEKRNEQGDSGTGGWPGATARIWSIRSGPTWIWNESTPHNTILWENLKQRRAWRISHRQFLKRLNQAFARKSVREYFDLCFGSFPSPHTNIDVLAVEGGTDEDGRVYGITGIINRGGKVLY